MILEVDPRSSVAPYDQLRQQITAMALAGSLAPGDRLPSIRQLANDLGIASGTVAQLEPIDDLIAETAQHWRPERFAIIDRLILRMAVCDTMARQDSQRADRALGPIRAGEGFAWRRDLTGRLIY